MFNSKLNNVSFYVLGLEKFPGRVPSSPAKKSFPS